MSIDYIFEGNPPSSVPPKTALGVDASSATIYVAQPQNGTWTVAVASASQLSGSGGTVQQLGTEGIALWNTTFDAGFVAYNAGDGYTAEAQVIAGDNSITVGGGSGSGVNWQLDNGAGSASITNPYDTNLVRIHGAVFVDQAPPAPGVLQAGQLGIGATLSPTATSGAATLPSNPVGFWEFTTPSGTFKVPYYNS